MRRRSVLSQGEIFWRSSRSSPSALRMAAAVASMSLVKLAEPTNASGLSPWTRAKSRYHAWRCRQSESVSSRFGLGRPMRPLPPARPAGGLGPQQRVNGDMGGLGEALELPARRARLAAFPTGKPREAARKVIELHAGAIARPAQQRRLHLDTRPRRLCHDRIRRTLIALTKIEQRSLLSVNRARAR